VETAQIAERVAAHPGEMKAGSGYRSSEIFIVNFLIVARSCFSASCSCSQSDDGQSNSLKLQLLLKLTQRSLQNK